jgi:hypothetical protein
MAEGLLRHLAGDRFEVMSAGTEATLDRPEATAAMAELGVDISGQESKTLERYLGCRARRAPPKPAGRTPPGSPNVEPSSSGVGSDQVQDETEAEHQRRLAEPPRTGGVTDSRISRITPSAVAPEAPPRTPLRCTKVLGTSALKSSGPTKSRPLVAARAWAALRWCPSTPDECQTR